MYQFNIGSREISILPIQETVFYCKIEVRFLCFFILTYRTNAKRKWNLMIIMPLLLNHWFIYGDVVVFLWGVFKIHYIRTQE